ncbi:MAG: TetR/AcrR family transcriptional regulator [Alphaproteobacteria bacterium]|nr:TetR/AcrR family transcriptional regulator [Alphaproteobacteria bacterium]
MAKATRSVGKRDAVLAAAQDAFLELGYGAASMDAVAARAGVSKATIYAHFPGKSALFGAVIAARCERAFAGLDLPSVEAMDAPAALGLIARRILDLLLSPESLAMYKVVTGEAARMPEMAEAFHAAGPAAAKAAIVGALADLDRRGQLRVADPELASELLVGMLKGDIHLRHLLGLPDGGRDREQIVEAVVRVMLRAYAPGG